MCDWFIRLTLVQKSGGDFVVEQTRVALLQASQAGFMTLWETKQGMQYESSILPLQTGLNTT